LFDLLLSGGELVDGTGRPRRRADVGVVGDRIAALGNLAGAQARQKIDCRSRVVAPGFIDVHNHSDGWMLALPHQTWKTSQGFTTEVLMADGISYAPVNEQTWRHWLHYLRSLNGLALADYTGWQTLEEYLMLLDRRNVQNAAFHVPYANVRTLACGFGRQLPPDDFQMRQIQAEIRRGMEAGAVGLSTGLDYIAQSHATTDELVAACHAIAPYGGLYVTHVRYKMGLLAALREAIDIGRRAGVKVHISHLKGWSEAEVQEVLALLDAARRDVDLSFDVYPYQRGSTMLNYLLPYEVWQDGPLGVQGHLGRPEIRVRFRAGLEAMAVPPEDITIAWTAAGWRRTERKEGASPASDNADPHPAFGHPLPEGEGESPIGLTVAEFARQRDRPVDEALLDLLIDSNLATLLVLGPLDKDHLVEPLIQHDLAILGSDGIYFPGGHVHPRVYGSAARWLGPLVRERHVHTLEAAVHKLSGKSAARFGLPQRGVIEEGAFADLVVFDPQAIADPATYDQPCQMAIGVEKMVVNGVLVAPGDAAGELPAELPGRYLQAKLCPASPG
jgi:N-acyl-D-amino-acid deacylase